MFNTKCGCPDCRKQVVVNSRHFWKSRRNKYNNMYGSFKNPTAKHHSRRPI